MTWCAPPRPAGAFTMATVGWRRWSCQPSRRWSRRCWRTHSLASISFRVGAPSDALIRGWPTRPVARGSVAAWRHRPLRRAVSKVYSWMCSRACWLAAIVAHQATEMNGRTTTQCLWPPWPSVWCGAWRRDLATASPSAGMAGSSRGATMTTGSSATCTPGLHRCGCRGYRACVASRRLLSTASP
jgi:hypothetical protein